MRLPHFLFNCSEEEEEEEGQDKADQLRRSKEAAEGLPGRHRQDQAAAATDQSQRSGPAQAALPVFRGAQAHRVAQQGAQIPQDRVNLTQDY